MNAIDLSRFAAVAMVLAGAAVMSPAQAATPAELLAGYTAQAAVPALPARGQQWFTSTHGRDWSCSSCHGAVPTQTGKHASTGKPIDALAPMTTSSSRSICTNWRRGCARWCAEPTASRRSA